ncbi:hypothetical protein HMPREF1979_01859 [Actinomyces johnsonii F0542]|uniref:Uncharacterized protein n=1 Tax=Actinomyces johnsonii F0542 TaxID=1321818 RepID=U1QMG6_9ACTO|nr:hypothetical protein HMPREF1979_01859 [Actinomyces johnsonii F0542]
MTVRPNSQSVLLAHSGFIKHSPCSLHRAIRASSRKYERTFNAIREGRGHIETDVT